MVTKLHMLEHVTPVKVSSKCQDSSLTQRAERIHEVGYRSKLIVKPKTFGRIGVHIIFELLKGYQTYNVPPEVALLYHFRVPRLYTSTARKEDKMVKYSSDLLARIEARICI